MDKQLEANNESNNGLYNAKNKPPDGEQKFPLLPYETNLMVDSFVDDVLFVVGRGLGVEQLFLNHLHLYSDNRSTVLIINTTAEDEHYFLEKLKPFHKQCPPKIMTAEVLSKDRELIYRIGGVQFITSRILMVDLLIDRVPLDKIAGILVYRAHQILTSFQESFILRLFREKRKNDKLYVKRVILVPRFDDGVKKCFDTKAAKFTQISLELPHNQRRIRNCLKEIMNTCVRDLKACTHGVDVQVESDALAPAAGLQQTRLEMDLRKKTLLLSERQERILTDLHMLRILLHKVEDMDPTNAWAYICKIRNDKDVLEKNSGWIFTPTASTVFSNAESLVFVKDPSGYRTITPPAKWSGLNSVLEELASKILRRQQEGDTTDSPVLVLVSNEQTCRQLIDLVKFGRDKFCWMLTKNSAGLKRSDDLAPQPLTKPMWNAVNIVFYDSQVNEKDRLELLGQVKDQQKKAGRETRKRCGKKLMNELDTKQPRLAKFGITRYSSEKTIANQIEDARNKKRRLPKSIELVPEGMLPEDPLTDHYFTDLVSMDNDSALCLMLTISPPKVCDANKNGINLSNLRSMLVFLSLGDRYNLLNCLETLKPAHVVLHNSDIVSTRLIESFKAHNPDHPLEIYALMYTDTTEEERYLVSIQREQAAFESLIKEQGVLMVPTEFDVTRDSASQLRRMTLQRDSRSSQPAEKDIQPKIVIDMREFNSELPTVLYCRGIDLQAATLEVGDYILSNEICVERKALDDLSQSLHNGRVFKQVEQMLRNYPKTILLVESSEKFRQRKVNGGPFQGELSRRSRETRSLLTMLIRAHPQLTLLWSFSPSHSAELFEEIKLDQPNPDVDVATSIRSDDLFRENGEEVDLMAAENENEIISVNPATSNCRSMRLNTVLKRQLLNLPGFLAGDVERLMRNCASAAFQPSKSTADDAPEEDNSLPVSNLNQLVRATPEKMAHLLGNAKQSEVLGDFFQIDFRFAPMK
uniref:DNA repair endonuclease XPF n=1 Tax=Ditylenchus dipsaci TaxID=166011 RepID=A0A915DY22_9BILA